MIVGHLLLDCSWPHSEISINSEWVGDEVDKALAEEK
jgi:hypothetical protein